MNYDYADKYLGYIPIDEGWLYLSIVKNLCTKQLVGYAFSDRIDSNLTITALNMAVHRRKPEPCLISTHTMAFSMLLPPIASALLTSVFAIACIVSATLMTPLYAKQTIPRWIIVQTCCLHDYLFGVILNCF